MKKISVIGLRGFPGVQGGVEVHCERLYQHFSKDSQITVYRRNPYLTEHSNKKYENISFIDYPSTRIKGFEAVCHTFLSVCDIIVKRPDVVHVHNIGPGMFIPMLKLFGRRVGITYHSPNYEHKKWGWIARNILKFSEWLSLNFADEVIFVNKFQMEKVGQNYQKKSHYIPNGINNVERSKDADFLMKHGITPGKYVLAVGRITPEKGFDVLVEAVNKSPEVEQLVIAGASDHSTEYYERLKELDKNGKVIFTGFTTGEDLRQLYSHARMFVLSSFNEGFPLVLLEAMGYGLPLVVSDIPATHLLTFPDEDYVPVGDAEAMSKAISDKWHKVDGSMVKYDLTEFNWSNIAVQTEKLLTGK